MLLVEATIEVTLLPFSLFCSFFDFVVTKVRLSSHCNPYPYDRDGIVHGLTAPSGESTQETVPTLIANS
jgi:hypothetical protein